MANEVYAQTLSNDVKNNNAKFAENLKTETTLCLFLTKNPKDFWIVVTKRDIPNYEELFMHLKKLRLPNIESYRKIYAYARKTDLNNFEFQIFKDQDMSGFPEDDKLMKIFGSEAKYDLKTVEMPDEAERVNLVIN